MTKEIVQSQGSSEISIAKGEFRWFMGVLNVDSRPGAVIAYLFSGYFDISVPGIDIVNLGLDDEGIGRKTRLDMNILRARRLLPEGFSLYSFNTFSRYLLTSTKEIGSSFLPDFRQDHVKGIDDEIRPLLLYFNEVEVGEEDMLVSKIHPAQLTILNILGRHYSNPIFPNRLLSKVRRELKIGDRPLRRKETFWRDISLLRAAVSECPDGGYKISDSRGGGSYEIIVQEKSILKETN